VANRSHCGELTGANTPRHAAAVLCCDFGRSAQNTMRVSALAI
jgi:hypothetical protein